MRTCIPALALAAAFAAPASALTIDSLSDHDVRGYAAILANQTSSSQWQQLWRNTRLAGHFDSAGSQPRFTLPMREIPDLVRQTLVQPDHIERWGTSRTQLRRDFSPRVAGKSQGQDLSAICVALDWRGATQPGAGRPIDDTELRYVSLLKAKPC